MLFSVGQGLLLSFLRRKGEGRPASGPWRCGMHHPSRAAVPDAAQIMPFGRPAAPGETPCAQGRIKRSAPWRGNSASCTKSSQKSGHRAEQAEGLRGCSGQTVHAAGPTSREKSRPAFSPWERRWQPQTSCPDKIGGIIPGNLHRISHPFHFGMFIYTGALRSAKETERYIGGTKMSTTPAYRGGGLQLPGSADAASAAPTFGSTLLPSGWRCIVG